MNFFIQQLSLFNIVEINLTTGNIYQLKKKKINTLIKITAYGEPPPSQFFFFVVIVKLHKIHKLTNDLHILVYIL